MNERQAIFWTFLGLLLSSQCVSVVVSFPASRMRCGSGSRLAWCSDQGAAAP